MEGPQLVAFLAALALLLLVGRAAGDLARRAGQPEVLGALAAGVLLGPSVLGAVLPGVHDALLQGEQIEPALAGLSTLGAVLLLLVAGLEVDLRLLRRELRPGLLVGVTAIVPSLAAGAALGPVLGLRDLRAAFYLGIVLSVTAVSVVSSLLLESDQTRRRFAQVILAGGVAGEVSVWVLVSAVSTREGSPLLSGLRSLLLAVGVFVTAYFVGRRLVPGVMRAAADRSRVGEAPVTAVLILALAGGASTAALGLHPLLGAFLVGVLLARSPRTNAALLTRVESLTVGLFAPLFFVLAGARVDLSEILTRTAAVQMLVLFVVATVAKVLPVALGARLGGLRGAESWVVATGMTFKGGTDVLVAILGQQLHVLSVRAYTQYAVVSLLTVLVLPTLLRRLVARVPVSEQESVRLAHEEAFRRSYLPRLERVLVPFLPELRPSLAADVLDRLARTADARGRLLDVTQLHLDGEQELGHGVTTLAGASDVRSVRLRTTEPGGVHRDDELLEELLEVAKGHDLLALGARLDTESPGALSPLQNQLIDAAQPDVLLVAAHGAHLPWEQIHRILVPTNRTPHARAAAEVAAHLAETCGAEVVLLNVVDPSLGVALVRRGAATLEHSPATAHLAQLRFLLDPLDVRVREELRAGDPAEELAAELREGDYDLVVMGAVDQAGDAVALMGPTVEVVLSQHRLPYVLLVTHERTGAAAA